jgi:hypothetical protein
LRTLESFERGEDAQGREYARDGARRLAAAIDLTADIDALRAAIERERAGWDCYYDTLDALEAGIAAGEPTALRRRQAVREILGGTRVRATA